MMNNTQDRINAETNGLRNDLSARFTEVKNAAAQAGEQVVDSAKNVYSEIKTEGKEFANQVSSQTGRTIDRTREYVINNPFSSILIAAGAGLLFGYLRRRG